MVVVNANTKTKKDKDKDQTNQPADKKDKPDKPQSYVYVFADGVLKPIALRNGFIADLAGAQTNIVYDKSLNNAVHGAKGGDILLGRSTRPNRSRPRSTPSATP